MECTFLKDDKLMKLYEKVKRLPGSGGHSLALEILDDMISVVHREDENAWFLRLEQATIFMDLFGRVRNWDMEVVYLLGSLGCITEDVRLSLSAVCARLLLTLGERLGSVSYLRECIRNGRQGLSVPYLEVSDSAAASWVSPLLKYGAEDKKELEKAIKAAEVLMNKLKTMSVDIYVPPDVCDSKKSLEPRLEDRVSELRSFWMGLDVKVKRGFMKVNIEKLRNFVKGVHKREELDVLEHVLAIAREHQQWTVWVCRTKCDKVCFSAEECSSHLEEKHAADFKPDLEKDLVKRIGKIWAREIDVGDWEPVDTVAAVEMIKTQLEYVKAFTTRSKKNRWYKEWPLARNEERRSLLKEIKLLLVSLYEHRILSCSIRDWLMRFPVKHLRKLEVSEESIKDCRIVETPQSICFLECHDLSHIRDFLKKIKFERHDGADVVSRAVDSLLDRIRIKENIHADEQFSLLLLDKRNNASFDDDGKIKFIKDPDSHYAKALAQGDDMISWLGDCSSVDKSFPGRIKAHNLGIWVAVLRAVQYTCRTLGTKYEKKKQVLDYEQALIVVENLCISKDQRNSYASLLCDRCEERLPENSLTAKLFLCAVRDVLHEASHLTFDIPDLEDCLKLIRERKSLSNDTVWKSIKLQKSVVTQKVLLIDAKILLIDNSRIRLLKNLTGLSAFDNRSYMLHFLKPFLLNEIVNMESKAKSDAAEADLLLEEEKKSLKEEKKSQAKKTNKTKKIKKTSTSMTSPVDKTVEQKPSIDLEPRGTSQSPKTMEEPKDTLTTEKSPLEISSTNDIQEEATKVNSGDMQNIPGEDSVSGNLESALGGAATRYNSALDMTLKALMNINVLKEQVQKYNKQPVHDNLEEQVLCALQSLFTDVVSEQIKTEGVYSLILRDILVSLEQVNSMSSGAAELLVTILESWHCWKNSEQESLVTRLFTVEENERMRCRKCRKQPNYPEQSSYGIVIAADSIRDLKCTFASMKFVDILKVIRMEYKMLCDIKTGGCGTTNCVHHVINRCPPIFTIVLEWEKSETEEEISETTKALEWEIDISRLYEGLEQNTNYRLVSMVGYSEEEEEEHTCMVYEKNRWVNLRLDSLAGKVVGNSWKNVVRFCGQRKVRPAILLYEAARYPQV